MNNICLIGRLVQDIEIKVTTNGKQLGKFTLAVDRGLSKDQKDEGWQDTDFINIEVYGNLANVVERYSGKGKQVGVQGQLRIDNYKDREGNNRSYTKVLANRIDIIDWVNREERKEEKFFDENNYMVDDDRIPF